MLVIIRVFITFPSSEGSELGPYACHGRTTGTAQQCCIFPLGRLVSRDWKMSHQFTFSGTIRFEGSELGP